MSAYRFNLQKYQGPASRQICPQCKDTSKDFVPYIDSETKQPLHSSVGRCNRESKCGFHYTPKQFFEDNNIPFKRSTEYQQTIQRPKPVSYISSDMLRGSMKMYEENNFVHFLASHFSKNVVSEVLSKYFIGTSKHWPGATVFWQVDKLFRIRTGKIMLYNPISGRRVKEPRGCITWAHSALKLIDFEMKQCLYGEHLIADSNKVIAIVESEKTAIIASIYFPELTWVATGGLSNLTLEKIRVLSGRKVILFPDVKGFHKWDERMKKFSQFMTDTKFSISGLLEKNATDDERQADCDIADYFLKNTSVLCEPQRPSDVKSEKCGSQKTTLIYGNETGKISHYSGTLPEWYNELERKYDKTRNGYQPIHLFPSMHDQSYFLDKTDF